ncbi:hypothetical protein VNO80_30721 [Phaseolus coccineus]|uniref:fructose-bisphosphate aldolase n=1 Tax=Phaseolus coccineus TaxID=3886 RepID=A0AAN9LD98_PHACN
MLVLGDGVEGKSVQGNVEDGGGVEPEGVESNVEDGGGMEPKGVQANVEDGGGVDIGEHHGMEGVGEEDDEEDEGHGGQGQVPLAGSNNESWCQGLDGLVSRLVAYYQQGARFAKWRTFVSIPNGPSTLTVKEATWGLARYAAISQIDKVSESKPQR